MGNTKVDLVTLVSVDKMLAMCCFPKAGRVAASATYSFDICHCGLAVIIVCLNMRPMLSNPPQQMRSLRSAVQPARCVMSIACRRFARSYAFQTPLKLTD